MPSLDEPALFDAPIPSLDEPASVDEPVPSLDAPTSLEEPLSSLEEPLSSLEEPLSPLQEPLSPLQEPALDQAAVSGFDLDTATLPGQAAGSEGDQLPAEIPGEPAQIMGAEMESLGEESLEDLNLDQFSLPASAEEFGAAGAPAPEPKPRPAAPPRQRPAERKQQRPQPRAAAAPSVPGIESEIELTPEQFAQLKRALESLPRNLKIVVQDIIGEGTAAGADLTALVNLLLRDASTQEIAALAGRISGRRIRIPAGYEKRTGASFEAEQRTFAYAFRENFLPLLRVIAITVLAGGLFGFLGYNYVYRPLYAYANYRAGYNQIFNDRYTLANERFARATSVWPLKGWYYSYAEAFAAKRQYVLAEKKYDDLLRTYPGDKRGVLDYARMESTQLAGYEKADALLKQYLDAHRDDYDALLATGDNDLLWGDRDTSKLETARLSYAILLNKYGARDELLFRMLRFFIRTDNGAEVERLRAFYATRPDVKIDAPVFAELGGYLVEHRRLDYVQEVLFRADKTQPGLYQVHYNLARYYRIVQDSADEKKALDATVKLLDRTGRTDAITVRRLNVEIDTHTRLGEYSLQGRGVHPGRTGAADGDPPRGEQSEEQADQPGSPVWKTVCSPWRPVLLHPGGPADRGVAVSERDFESSTLTPCSRTRSATCSTGRKITSPPWCLSQAPRMHQLTRRATRPWRLLRRRPGPLRRPRRTPPPPAASPPPRTLSRSSRRHSRGSRRRTSCTRWEIRSTSAATISPPRAISCDCLTGSSRGGQHWVSCIPRIARMTARSWSPWSG